MLNNTKINRLKPGDKTYRELDSDGLYIEVKPNGRKFWRYRYRKADGKWTMISLGEYPETSIQAAREARDARHAQGRYIARTFSEIAKEWHDKKRYRSEKNAAVEWGRVQNYLIPAIGKMIISEIEPVHIIPILELIERKGHLELARRVRSIASQIFRFGVAKVACSSDPADLLKGSTRAPQAKPMPAIVEEEHFADLLRRIDMADHVMPSVKLALQVAPYVMLRSGELRKSRIEHIDLDAAMWTIPAELMKRPRDHRIPLHRDAVAILRRAVSISDGVYIFSGNRRGRPLSENTLNIALRSLGYGVGDVVFHGFRSSFSTLGREALRFEDDLIERQLAHVDKNATRAAYDRSYRIEERTAMMEAWGDYLAMIKG